MPRQPYLRVFRQPRGVKYDIGTHCIQRRPELESLISNCIMSWPFVEAEMAVLLGQLLGAKSEAAQAVFQTLRRSSAQRDAITEAAKVVLSGDDQELVGAVLIVHRSVEAERNALVHGHFGTATNLPDAFIWQTTNDYVNFRTMMTVTQPQWNDALHHKMLETLWVYRKSDLEIILSDIKELAAIWHDLTRLIQLDPVRDARVRAAASDRLRSRSHVAQVLDDIRQKNSASVPPASPPPGQSGTP